MDRVTLSRVVDNPFQTRQDYGEITDLANSILAMRGARPETSGLIQVPPGRVVIGDRVLDIEEYGGLKACLGDEPEAVVELAAGHRRLRAFRFLYDEHDHDWGSNEYESFPVEVQVLDNQAMADIAWEENVKRKDLSPIEEAEALRRALEAFGWSQAEVGERWGLSQPAVANKLRLLQLPDAAQAAIRKGQIGERHGRALLKAMGKSQRIYERAAAEIVPVAVEPAVAQKARELVEARWYHRNTTGTLNGFCGACGGPARGSAGGGCYVSRDTEDGTVVFLCPPCYRAGTEWSPPTAAEAEDEVKRTIRQESQRMDDDDFRPDREVGAGDPLVHQAMCEGCEYREELDGKTWCLDKSCYLAKKEYWYGHLVTKVQMRARQRWPKHPLPEVRREWGGNDLTNYSDTDKAMVAANHCGPHCKRLRFRYTLYEGDYLRPFAELPFVYNCDKRNAYNACVRRFKESQRSEEDRAEEALRQEAAKERQKEARELLNRAEVSVARALRAGHEGAWQALARLVGGQGGEASLREVAAALLGGLCDVDWEEETALAYFRDAVVKAEMERLGVGLLDGVEELERRLERISDFVVDVNRGERELTTAMVQGNLDNVAKVQLEVADLYRDKVMGKGDWERLQGWCEELRVALETRKHGNMEGAEEREDERAG